MYTLFSIFYYVIIFRLNSTRTTPNSQIFLESSRTSKSHAMNLIDFLELTEVTDNALNTPTIAFQRPRTANLRSKEKWDHTDSSLVLGAKGTSSPG